MVFVPYDWTCSTVSPAHLDKDACIHDESRNAEDDGQRNLINFHVVSLLSRRSPTPARHPVDKSDRVRISHCGMTDNTTPSAEINRCRPSAMRQLRKKVLFMQVLSC
jgi:hypothetical protein